MWFVGINENARFKGLALFHFAGQPKFLDGDVVTTLHAERNYIHGHAQRSGGQHGGHGITEIFVSIGHHNQSLLTRFRKRRRAKPNRRAEVGTFRRHHGIDFLHVHGRAGGNFDGGVRAKHHDAGPVSFLLFLRSGVDVFARRLLLRRRNAVGSVEKEQHVHAFERAHPLQTGERKHDEQ